MILKHVNSIDAPAELVFDFFEYMDANYVDWHPDHSLFRWERGTGLRVGTIFYFEERIAGKLQKKRMRFIEIERNHKIVFAPTNHFYRLFLPRLTFLIEPRGNSCRLRAEIEVRMGPLAVWWHRHEIQAVRQHMHEEGANLKEIVEREVRKHATDSQDVSVTFNRHG